MEIRYKRQRCSFICPSMIIVGPTGRIGVPYVSNVLAPTMADVLRSLEINKERFFTLLEKLINNADKVQVRQT